MLGDPDEMAEAQVGVEVEAELGRLDRDLAGDARRHDPVDGIEVVGGDLIRLVHVFQVLAKPRVQRGDAGRLQRQGRRQGVRERLAGHESTHGTAHESELREPFLQPSIAGGPQEDPAHADLQVCPIRAPSDGPESDETMIGDGGSRIAPA